MTPTAIKSIRFRAGFIRDGKYESPLSEFKLGPGPCGKNVVGLYTDIKEGCLQVTQECEDGEVKAFVYPLSQLTGRIEATAS